MGSFAGGSNGSPAKIFEGVSQDNKGLSTSRSQSAAVLPKAQMHAGQHPLNPQNVQNKELNGPAPGYFFGQSQDQYNQGHSSVSAYQKNMGISRKCFYVPANDVICKITFFDVTKYLSSTVQFFIVIIPFLLMLSG